ncbi:MAG: undecaprenyl/decaprenyl-phosphate alpha-N-acetylglucosaminyl 1-phosphate transferase [Candidatus Melainabacteria bacterium]|nr:undecaprenyl/decaprenyl-phosphate alpha-N-acetylglucosaminyl 1-phosphate transferase [Candidatus Melainabacteria bacterium]
MLANKILFNIQFVQAAAFLCALTIAYLLTPLIQSRAMKLGLLDKPSERKLHDKPIPRLGGVSVFASLFLTSLLFLSAYWSYRHNLFSTFTLLGIFSGGTIIFFLGLLDDIEPLSPVLKLLIQILAASVAWFLGIKILYLANPFYHADFYFFKFSMGGQSIHFTPLVSYFLTLMWIVVITNAVNLVDGMDGLATGVSLISAIAIWAVSVDYRINQPAGALMAATLAGALLGFLRWNFNPARIFLGDSGAYLTGFFLSALAISCVTKKIAVAVIAPVLFLIFAFPIGDTLFAVIRRTLSRKSILEPDKGHLHHRMLAFGFSQKIASYLLYLLSALLGLLASYLISLRSSCRFLILSLVVIFIALFYACIINWRRQKIFRNLFMKTK